MPCAACNCAMLYIKQLRPDALGVDFASPQWAPVCLTCHADSALTPCMLAQVSTLNFVDLAGSERSTLAAKDDGDNKLRQTEGSAINKSLLTLGNVIRGLGDGRVGQPCSATALC